MGAVRACHPGAERKAGRLPSSSARNDKMEGRRPPGRSPVSGDVYRGIAGCFACVGRLSPHMAHGLTGTYTWYSLDKGLPVAVDVARVQLPQALALSKRSFCP